jgi:polysaccharide biosynthesis/export protein
MNARNSLRNQSSLFSTISARFAWLAVAAMMSVPASACKSTGSFVWVQDVPSQSEVKDFLIRDTDTVSVRVYQQDPLSSQQRVRPDGKIVVPMAGEFTARGKRPKELGKEIEDKLKGFLVTPIVTVSVEQSAQVAIAVVGQVRNAGSFNMDPGSNVLQALASAGGLNDFANDEYIFVIRRGMDQRVRFKFADLRNGDKKAVAFALQAGDVVVVE